LLRFPCGHVLWVLLTSVFSFFRSRATLQLEILALRHQVGVLQLSVKRPKLTPADRLLWAWLCGFWNDWASVHKSLLGGVGAKILSALRWRWQDKVNVFAGVTTCPIKPMQRGATKFPKRDIG
jgi:hypothetical protein